MVSFSSVASSLGFETGVVRKRLRIRVPFTYHEAFLPCVRSASVGDASLCDRHFVANNKKSSPSLRTSS